MSNPEIPRQRSPCTKRGGGDSEKELLFFYKLHSIFGGEDTTGQGAKPTSSIFPDCFDLISGENSPHEGGKEFERGGGTVKKIVCPTGRPL